MKDLKAEELNKALLGMLRFSLGLKCGNNYWVG